MLISQDYKSQNESLHQAGQFGVSGYKWAQTVSWLLLRHGFKHVLDYGAGQQTLKKSLQGVSHVRVDCYDPAVPELAHEPAPAELLTCTDVLEHIEPDAIDAVLNHIQSLAQKMVLLVIPTGPAAKTLPDGRNAHLIQQPVGWWLPKLLTRFDLVSLNHLTDDIVFVGTIKAQTVTAIDAELMNQLSQLSEAKLLSVTFDGLAWNFAVKSHKASQRFIPRLLSVFKLGLKVGVSLRLRKTQHAPRVTVTYY